MDYCFWLDILLTFRTTYKHPRTGDEIADPRKIAKNYISGTFWIDFVSSVNFEFLGSLIFPEAAYHHQANKAKEMIVSTLFDITVRKNGKMDSYDMISCLKLVRVLRLGKLINYLNESDELKLQLRLFKLCFFFLLHCHIAACVWYMVNVYNDDQWIPAQWEKFVAATNSNSNFYERSWQTRYTITFYNAILMLLGNDIQPTNIPLVCLGIILMISGAFVEANLFGSMTNILSTQYVKSTKFQDQIDQANSNMKNMKLPEEM